jgi:periplasmic divalent cation tolerance protein
LKVPEVSEAKRSFRTYKIMLIVFTTTADEAEAEILATQLVEQKLAACVQILPKISSVYVWKGKIRRDSECLLLIKTGDEKFTEVEAFIKSETGYETPEIVAVKADSVSDSYSDWLDGCLKQ